MSESKPSASQSYSPGLDGIIAGESAICSVHPDTGLRYYGYGIEALADKLTFESVAWLLLHGEMPSDEESKRFSRQLTENASLPPQIVQLLKCFPRTTRAMDYLRTGISALAAFDPDLGKFDHESNQRKAIRLISRMTSVTTAGWRVLHSKEPVATGDLSLAGRLLMGISGNRPEPWTVRVMDTVMNLYAEHEFNASTFASRVTASTLADIYPAIVTALGALEGPLHGGANEQAMTMIQEVGSPQAAEAWVKSKLANHEKIMGFGHRVYKKGDSRVPVMRQLLAELCRRKGDDTLLETCKELERVMENQKKLFANLDLYAAPVLHLLEIPTELNTPLFACARVSGWCAHVIEQQDHNRIIRPRSLYTGPAARDI